MPTGAFAFVEIYAMNVRSPTVVLTAEESTRIRVLVRERGPESVARALGNIAVRTLMKAAAEAPVSRLTAEVIRYSLDRI